MVAGIIALTVITPAAVTSFRIFQHKLGRTWRQIHLFVPTLALAIFHTVLIAPHYIAQFQIEMLDHLRTYEIAIATLLVLLVRRKIFWSILKLLKITN